MTNTEDIGHSNGSQAKIQLAHPYLALMGLYLGAFTGMYSETALNIALPQLSAAFGVQLSLAQWLVVGYMLVIGLVLPFASILLKWVPARKLTLFALCAFFCGSLISGFAPTFAVLLAGRLIQGIGTGLILPTMFAMVMEVIPPHRIGAAMGVSALVIMFASAIGPTLSGLIVGALSWRWVFFSFAIFLAVGIVFALKFEVNPYRITKPKVDLLSVVLSCLGFGGLVLGAGIASLFGWISAPTLGALAVGVACLAAYARRQFSLETPVLDLHPFAIPEFRNGAVCMMLNFGITLSAMYVLPQFYQNAMLLAVSVTGLVMLPGGLVNALVSMVAGRIYDRIGARGPAMAGFGLSALGAALLLLADASSPLPYVMACHIVMMLGIPLAMSPCQTHALASLPGRLSTDGSTILNTMQQVMGAICTAVATSLLAAGQDGYYAGGGTQSALAFTQGAHYGFAFTLILALFCLVLSTRLKPAAAATATQTEREPAGEAAMPLLARLMKTDVYTLTEQNSALEALELFTAKKISAAPVVDENGKLTGYLSDCDIFGTISHQHPAFASFYAVGWADDAEFNEQLKILQRTTVGQLASRNVYTVDIDDDMRDVCTLLCNHDLKKVPVMKDGEMVGVINRSNITHYTVDAYRKMDEEGPEDR